MSLQGDLNRLLGTAGLGSQRAANELAGTSGKELLSALNTIAGTAGKGLVYVLNLIAEQNAGFSGYDPQGAVDSIPTGAIIVGGFDSFIVGFSSPFGGKYTPFRDAAGLVY